MLKDNGFNRFMDGALVARLVDGVVVTGCIELRFVRARDLESPCTTIGSDWSVPPNVSHLRSRPFVKHYRPSGKTSETKQESER